MKKFKNIMLWFDSHLEWISILYFMLYCIAFFIVNMITVPKYIIHSPIDDIIPFNEYFIIPYLSWFIMIVGSLLYFVMKDKEDYLHECFMMYVSMTLCILIYLVLPNGLDLRVNIPDTNIFCRIVSLIQGIDNPTNVCPSIHVCVTCEICMVVWKSKHFQGKRAYRYGTVVWAVLIILSTMFLKQHSIIDVFWGAIVAIVMYLLAYHTKLNTYLR